MILCLGPTPAAQRVMVFRKLNLDAVNRAATTLEVASGKPVNVAKVLQELGASPIVTGVVGGARGEFVRSQLLARQLPQDFITVAAQTRQCLTVIDETTGMQTELVEESQPVAPSDYVQLEEVVRRRLADCEAIILSGSLTPGGPMDFYRRCVQLAKQAKAFAAVDAQGASLIAALEAKPDLIKPNRAEVAATVGRELKTEPELRAAMHELHERGAQRVVVTNGRQPTLASDGSRCWRITPPIIKALNPIGSGDAFTAALVWRLLRGDNLGEACRWGSASGAANALTLLPGELERGTVEQLLPQIRVESIA